MSRRKQRTILDAYNHLQMQAPSKNSPKSFVPEYPISSKVENGYEPDSLQRFQWELQNSLMQKRDQYQKNYQSQRSKYRRNRAQTEYNDQPDDGDLETVSASKLKKLQKELSELKGELAMNRSNGLQNKLDRLLEEMVKNRQADRQFFKQQRNSTVAPQQPNNIFYPPMPFYPPYGGYDRPRSRDRSQERSRDQQYRSKETTQPVRPRKIQKPKQEQDSVLGDNPKSMINTTKSATMFPPITKKRNTKKLSIKKYFYAVLFTKFLKKQAHTLARARKINFRNFFIEKFDTQIASLKDWLKQGLQYALPVILQKEETSLDFWTDLSSETEKQKQDLLLNIVKIGLQKMRKQCVSHKMTIFSQLLNRLCMRGSYVMSRFWSAYQLRTICVSEFYGCIRADDSLEKHLIGMVVFVKLLIFNMILQPHKIDRQNFSKNNEKLSLNMYVIGSTYYRLVKQVLKGYLSQKRPSYYKLGNWLNVKQQFLVQCCQPLRFKVKYPQQGQWLSGLLNQQLQVLQKRQTWKVLKMKVKQILDLMHIQIKKRRKDSVRGDKYKLHN